MNYKNMGLTLCMMVILISQTAAAQRKADLDLTKCAVNVENIATALVFYEIDFPKKKKSLDRLQPNYLKVLPQCPVAKKLTYYQIKKLSKDKWGKANWRVTCKGNHHLSAGLKADQPYKKRNDARVTPAKAAKLLKDYYQSLYPSNSETNLSR